MKELGQIRKSIIFQVKNIYFVYKKLQIIRKIYNYLRWNILIYGTHLLF